MMEPDIGDCRKFVLPSPSIFARLAAEARVKESLEKVRACLDAETIAALVAATERGKEASEAA